MQYVHKGLPRVKTRFTLNPLKYPGYTKKENFIMHYVRFIIFYMLILSHTIHCTVTSNIVGTVDDPSHLIVAPGPIAITPDGTKVYVANTNFNASSICIIDLTANPVQVVGTFTGASLNEPVSMAISNTPHGTLALVVNSVGPTVSVIDADTDTALYAITDASFSNLQDIAISTNGTQAYVTDEGNNSVHIIDLTQNPAVVNGIIADGNFQLPQSVAMNPSNDTQAYVVNTLNNTVSIVNVSTNTVESPDTIQNSNFNHAQAVIFAPNGKKAYVANYDGNNISIVDTQTNAIGNPGLINDPNALINQPWNAAITPDGKALYILNSNNTIVQIDTTTNAVVSLVPDLHSTLNIPYGMTITPDEKTGYISNSYGNSVSIMTIQSTPDPAILPPASVNGCQAQNIFLLQTELINKITWAAPTSGITPVKYKIYRDAALTEPVATVPAAGSLEYYDHNRQPNIIDSYYIISIDANGNRSSANSVTVTQPC